MAKRRREEDTPEQEVVVYHDPINEQVVLAAAVVDQTVLDDLLRRLPPETFSVEEHKAAWHALGEMRRRNLSYDPATFQKFAGDKVRAQYISELTEVRGDVPDNLEWHVDGLLWDRQRAAVARGPVAMLLEALKNTAEEPERVRAIARHVGEAFAGASGSGRWLHDAEELVKTHAEEVARRVMGRASYPYGIKGLDYYEEGATELVKGELRDIGGMRRMIPGAAPGQITLLAGPSGGGKSTLASALSLGLMRQERMGLYCAWEPNGGQVIELMACQSLGWSRTALSQGKDQRDGRSAMPKDQFVLFEERMHEISRWVTFMKNPFWRDRSGKVPTNNRNLDILEEHVALSGAEWVVCDLWERLMEESRPDQEKSALFRQQAMAEQSKVHYILLAQHRKDEEQRQDKRPTRAGIAGSGAWSQVADTILAPFRLGQWKTGIPDDKLELFILKQRWGRWPLAIEFDWDGDRGRISGGRSIPYEQPGERGVGDTEGTGWAPVKGAKRGRKS